MSIQETALYGDLVLYLRARLGEILAGANVYPDIAEAENQLDVMIRAWFFTPQDELYGSSPRDVIWREQLNMGNPIPPDYAHDAFDPDCDCPICQMALEEMEAGAGEAPFGGYYHSWQWTYCPESGLIDRYDPEGSEDRWLREQVQFQPQHDPDHTPAEVPPYQPPAVDDLEVSPEEFLTHLDRQSGYDKRYQPYVEQLLDRFDCPIGRGLINSEYRRLSREECLILLDGLAENGLDLDELVGQAQAWPYQNISLEWLARPDRELFMITRAMETQLNPADKTTLIRFRQHRDFLFMLEQIVPYNARIWLQGWLSGLLLSGQEADA